MTEPPGWTLLVGQPFWPGVTSYPERFEYRVFGGHHLLQICAGRLTPTDKAAFQDGAIHLGLFISQGVIFVLFKIAGLHEWSDQAFSIHLVSAEDRELPPHQADLHQLLNIVLVEAETGLVAGIRSVTWSSHASAVLNKALHAQMTAPFSLEQHENIVADVYTRYPNSKALARAALLTERAGSRF